MYFEHSFYVPVYWLHGSDLEIQPEPFVTHPSRNVLQSESLFDVLLSAHYFSAHAAVDAAVSVFQHLFAPSDPLNLSQSP